MRTPIIKNLSLVLAEDAWNGDAHAIIRLDGVVVWNGSVTAARGGAGQMVDLGAQDMSLQHKVTVTFDNDSQGSLPGQDRNLYMQDLLVDGKSDGWRLNFMKNGSISLPLGTSGGPVAVGNGPDSIDLAMAGDAFQGDAQFAVLLDGVQVGDVQSARASAQLGQTQLFHVGATLGAGSHQVTVRFLNDKYGTQPGQDRNLYLRSVALNGVDLGNSATLATDGDATFRMPGAAKDVSVGTGSHVFKLQLNEDAWQGDAQMAVLVDGVQVGGPITITADRTSGQLQNVSVYGDFGPGQHQLTVRYLNDAYGGSPLSDRNLHVQSVAYDGEDIGGAHVSLMDAGDGVFNGGTPLPPEPPHAPASLPAIQPVSTVPAAPAKADIASPVAPLHVGANADTGLVPVDAYTLPPGAHTISVGVGKAFSTIAGAVNAAKSGDVILVDAGTYTNDFVVNHVSITLVAVGGRVTMNATVPPPNWKGIITMEADLKVVGFTFQGAHIPDEYGHNGAGIRIDTGSLVLQNSSFDHNQNGVLGGGPGATVTIDHCVFDQNGGNDGNGAGNIHNIYLGNLNAVTVTNSIFENAQIGHEFKSRAVNNTLTNNVFISGVGVGTGSYDIDIPNGGKAVIENNTIIKGPNAENRNMVHFGGEGIPYAGSSLTVTGNLFDSTAAGGYAVLNATPVTAKISGNVFSGIDAASIAQGPSRISGNQNGGGAAFGDATLEGLVPGSTVFFTDDADHSLALDGRVQAVQGGGGRLTLDVIAGACQVIGGSGGIDVRESATSATARNQYTTAAGSTNSLLMRGWGGDLVLSQGNDTINTGDGNNSGQVLGTATIVAGAGSETWSIDGTASIVGGTGSLFLSVGAAGKLSVRGTTAFWQVGSNGGAIDWSGSNGGKTVYGAVTGGAVTASVYDGVVHLATAAGGAGAELWVDQGGAEIRSLGADTIHAGSGDMTIQTSGAARIYAGTGKLDVAARSNAEGAILYGNGGTVSIGGDGGNITYYGGDKANTVDLHVSNLTLVGGAGRMTVNNGARTTIVGGSGGLVFNGENSGAMTITTAAGSKNTLVAPADVTIHSFGTDTITHTWGGNSSFDVHGDSTLELANGGMTVDLYGHDVVTAHDDVLNVRVHRGAMADLRLSGWEVVSVESGSSVSLAYSDTRNTVLNSGSVAVAGGAASLASSADSGVVASFSEDGVSSVVQASGHATLQSHAADTIHISAGTVGLSLFGSGAEVWAGEAALKVNAISLSANRYTLHGGTGQTAVHNDGTIRMRFIGGSGSAVLQGGAQDVVAGSGAITATLDGALSFVGGAGTADLSLSTWGGSIALASGAAHVRGANWGSAMSLLFQGSKGGRDVIDNYRPGTDHASLGAGVSVIKQSEVGADVRLLLSNGGDVTFTGLAGRGFHLG